METTDRIIGFRERFDAADTRWFPARRRQPRPGKRLSLDCLKRSQDPLGRRRLLLRMAVYSRGRHRRPLTEAQKEEIRKFIKIAEGMHEYIQGPYVMYVSPETERLINGNTHIFEG